MAAWLYISDYHCVLNVALVGGTHLYRGGGTTCDPPSRSVGIPESARNSSICSVRGAK